MNPALKLNVFVGFPAYASNGGTSQEHPDIRDWWCETLLEMKSDARIGEITTLTLSDTPVTMVRNKFVRRAKEEGAHILLMIDSDQSPNLHKGEHWFKPFWREAFNFIYSRYLKGPHVVAAPYCGPPGGSENVYVFKWENFGDRGEETNFKLEAYTRGEAEKMAGIQEAAALPTGLIAYDMRAFDLIEPSKLTKRQVLEALLSGELTVEQAEASLYEGYFHYEWNDQYADEKGSTEDVSNTRNIAMNGIVKLGYNPIHCAWDSWIGHWKPWNVGKPKSHKTEHIGSVFKKVVLDDNRQNERIINLELPDWVKSRMNGRPKPSKLDTWNVPWQDGHSTPPEHLEALRYEIGRLLHPRVLEVGTWLGASATAMADAGAQVHCVDTWEGTPGDETSEMAQVAGGPDAVYAEFVSRIGARLGRTIFPWRGTSAQEAAKAWPNQFDRIFIDADHGYEACKANILEWWPHLKDDGEMLGHDYGITAFPGVKKAVNELFGKPELIGSCSRGSIWKVRKQDYPNLLEKFHEPATA